MLRFILIYFISVPSKSYAMHYDPLLQHISERIKLWTYIFKILNVKILISVKF